MGRSSSSQCQRYIPSASFQVDTDSFTVSSRAALQLQQLAVHDVDDDGVWLVQRSLVPTARKFTNIRLKSSCAKMEN